MLKDFVYFDEEMVLKFASQLDGGQRTRLTEKQTKRRQGRMSFGAGGAGVGGAKESAEDREVEFTDDPFAAFDRLLAAGGERPDDLSWVDVNDPDSDLKGIGRGFTVQGEADFEIPPFSRLVGSKEQLQGLSQLTNLMESLAPLMNKDAPTSKLDLDQVNGATRLAESFGGQISVVGSFQDSDWSVVGNLSEVSDIDDMDGPLIFVGKVVEVIPSGSHKSLMALPGATLLSREQRRKMQQEPPSENDANWVKGPALVLKFLAIYR